MHQQNIFIKQITPSPQSAVTRGTQIITILSKSAGWSYSVPGTAHQILAGKRTVQRVDANQIRSPTRPHPLISARNKLVYALNSKLRALDTFLHQQHLL